MHLANYLGLIDTSEKLLADSLEKVARHHQDESDVEQTCLLLSAWSRQHHGRLQPFIAKYSEDKSPEPDRLHNALFDGVRNGSLGLLRDLHDLWLLANEVDLCWILISQAALGLRDKELEALCTHCKKETRRQLDWLMTRMKQAAPQTLIVAD
ncbi:molybdopterin oxidoreductase [Hymenobacter sp. BT491]|uniref:molybdopterin oxidoreductase n=1 Tax=Hymenobacter sp. BT491 TaxID=2766779 RepID=UPI0016538D20|nr:molybdopterin oxidoreductase [Hymenobacter sp. BT491]MBC6989507.1 molybdopterin oxidoreductase [Hymenobacter sp. BT491]